MALHQRPMALLGRPSSRPSPTTATPLPTRAQHRPAPAPRQSQRPPANPRQRLLLPAVAAPEVADVEADEASTSSSSSDDCGAEFLSAERGLFTVRGYLRVAAPAGLVYDVLTDYDACPRVFSGIEDSSVVRREPSLEVMQKCRWSFLAFSGTFNAHLSVDEDPVARKLVFKLVQSSFMKDFEGRWELRRETIPPAPSAGGAAAAGAESETTLVEHILSVQPAIHVPYPISLYTRSIFVRQVGQVMRDLQEEVWRRQQQQQ